MTAARRRQNPRRRPVHRRITPALVEVVKDAKTTKDPTYAKILSSTLTSILGWAEQRLLAYHDTFDNVNINSMQSIVSLGVSAAKILVEDISNEYRRRWKNDTDVARSRTDTYIRSSLRTTFAQCIIEHGALPCLLSLLANNHKKASNKKPDGQSQTSRLERNNKSSL
ncbi:hypothetical protein HanXRQr2_Chr10g0450801 [Helianthus annuus]|uniref:Uncharacterized protein n=2 Tax=Helianthus annuus TaxID=4232 RepID=A0A9K3HYF7_HELAN|nr:hypothetical protein HanXRQr2_Chr10g0450801 [Helianthus annuus]KAJ0522752.1 putative protein unc-13 [Helianthus annuus]